MSNYAKIIRDNLSALYADLPGELEKRLPARRSGDTFEFQAFGAKCRLQPNGISLDDKKQDNPVGILVSLYALHTGDELCKLEPFRTFKEFPDSMPYIGAFTSHTESILLPHVNGIKISIPAVIKRLSGQEAPTDISGDAAFVVFPLPKIALCYIFYDADDDFPPSVTCLFSNNAHVFLPVAALADVGEYTSKAIIDILR